MHPSQRRHHGFTLIEMIAVIVVLGIIGSLISNLILTSADLYMQASTRSQLHGNLSVALDRILREVREIPSDHDEDEPVPQITRANARSLTWSGDRELAIKGSTLLLNTDGVHDDVLCHDVSAVKLDYLDQSGQSLLRGRNVPRPSLGQIRVVVISISLTRQGVTDTLHSRAFIRSCMKGHS